MVRSLGLAGAVSLALLASVSSSRSADRTLPMYFKLRVEASAEACAAQCRLLVVASGAITSDTPRDFRDFAKGRDLSKATLVLDSDGGSVHGAMALGRDVRRLGLSTTVGRSVDVEAPANELVRARVSPRADCESMCAFLLLSGVTRSVPAEARVMVHQIWLGDRRDDPTAASYSAEDLVLVQRDIGRLVQYTAEMGATSDLIDLTLRIPPWEPMHALTAEELRRTRLVTEPAAAAEATVAVSPPPPGPAPAPRMTNGLRATPINERQWAMVDRAGTAALARRHPLTVEGEDIGSFDLLLACGDNPDSYELSYIERRHRGEGLPVPDEIGAITVRMGRSSATLAVVGSQRAGDRDELVTFASGPVSADLIGAFAGIGSRSLSIETRSGDLVTAIRLGNTGARQALPRLAGTCIKPLRDHAQLPSRPAAGNYAAAQ